MKDNLFRSGILKKNFEFDLENFFDNVMWLNFAYLNELKEQRIISKEDSADINKGLRRIFKEGIKGLEFEPKNEDLILHVEKNLIKDIGPKGGKLHTGRSRNDMGHTLLRMHARELCLDSIESLANLAKALLDLARKYKQTPFPALTHGQHAQITSFSHYILAFIFVVNRDLERLKASFENLNLCSQGAAALTTSSWPINRKRIAETLAFDDVLLNSYDCVSNADCIMQYQSSLRMATISISRLVNDLFRGMMQEFSWFSLPDEYVQISSIMPQKRNPVVLEHLRGKLSKLTSQLDAPLLMALKTPFEDINDVDNDLKEIVNDTSLSFVSNVNILTEILSSLKLNENTCLEICKKDFSAMTELSDWLVKKHNISFREVHEVVSSMVDILSSDNKDSSQIKSQDLEKAWKKAFNKEQTFSNQEIEEVLNPQSIIESRNTEGGTSLTQINSQISIVRKNLDEICSFTKGKRERIDSLRSKSLKI
ncbi:argininosuccinate lyase [Nanoarchaeota archaeon]